MKIEIENNVIECQKDNTFSIDKAIDSQNEENNGMNLKEAFEFLGISEHLENAWKSSSTGELFFLQDYIVIANFMKETGYKNVPKFTKWFNDTVDYAYKHWERPISIYQHLMRIENFT